MDLSPFALKEWLEKHKHVRHDLAGSTGPQWALGELLELGQGVNGHTRGLLEELLGLGNSLPDIRQIALGYAPSNGDADLRREIAIYHGVNPDWVVVTNGASEAVQLLLIALARPGGRVTLPSPGYPAFAAAANAAGVAADFYAMSPAENFRASPREILAATGSDTILVIVNSPHNPTGAVIERDTCIALAEALREAGIPLLVDEVFHPLYFGEAQPSAADLANVVVVGDMSKALSMPGLRIGWIIDADARRRERIVRARSYLSLGGSPLLEALALHALRNRKMVLDRVRNIASHNLAQLRLFMAGSRELLDWVPPSGGLLAFPWFRDGRNSRAFCERLIAQGVSVAPGDCFGMPAHLRVDFGSQPGGIAEPLKIIEKELHK